MSEARLTEQASVALETYIVDIAWSPDGGALAVAGGEGAIVLVEDAAERPKAHTLGEHAMGAIRVAWQPGASAIASSGQDNSVALWDAAQRTELKRLHPGMAWTEHLAFSPSGEWLALATGKLLTLWNRAGDLVHKFEPHAATISAIAWDKPGRDLAAAMAGGVHVHRIEPPQFSVRKYGWPAACLTAAFSPNGKVLATGTQDGTVHFWNLSTGRDSQMRGYSAKVTLTEWSANSRYLATAAGNDVIVWDFGGRGPEGTRPLELRGHTERITGLAFQPNGPWLVSCGRDWRLSLWQPGRDVRAVDAHLTGSEITAMRWSPDGQRIAVGESKGRLTIHALENAAAPAKSRR